MNRTNKSLVAMRKAGLVSATALTEEQQALARRYLDLARAYCSARSETTRKQQEASYVLGQRGIRIGQEDLFCRG